MKRLFMPMTIFIILYVSILWGYKGTKGYTYKGDGGPSVPACTVMLCNQMTAYAETTLTNGMGYYELSVDKAGYYHLWGWKTINDTLWRKIYWGIYLNPMTSNELLEHDIILEPQP